LIIGSQNDVVETVVLKWEYGHKYLKVFKDVDVAYQKLMFRDSIWRDSKTAKTPAFEASASRVGRTSGALADF
jgi:hypothetical protein